MFAKDRIEKGIGRVLTAFNRRSDEPAGVATLGARLGAWAERVVAWNQRMDLTAARSVEELVDLLVADAAALSAELGDAEGLSCVDVGSGAGAPGLALALLVPTLEMTLVEPKSKRVAFLRSTLAVVARNDVKVERARSEELPSQGWDLAVSRATFDPTRWREEGARLARRRVWVMLAQRDPPDLDGFRIARDLEYVWPLTGIERRAIAYERDA